MQSIQTEIKTYRTMHHGDECVGVQLFRVDGCLLAEIRRGCSVKYRPAFGSEPAVEVKVLGFAEHKGQYVLDLEGNRWCYIHQVDQVYSLV